MKLSTHHSHLMPRLRIYGALPPVLMMFSLPVQIGTNTTFLFCCNVSSGIPVIVVVVVVVVAATVVVVGVDSQY